MSTTTHHKTASHGKHKRRHKRSVRKTVRKEIKAIDASVHLFVALALVGIAVGMLVETVRTLLTTPGPFPIAAGNAVGGILFVLIIVEITRTVFAGSNGVTLRKLLVITIVSTLRGVLFLGALASIAVADGSGQTFNRALELALGTAVVLVLAVAFTLVRRASAGR